MNVKRQEVSRADEINRHCQVVKVDGDNKMPMRRSRASKQINPEPITFNDAATVVVVDSNCADLIYYEGKTLHSCAKHEILNFHLRAGIINVSARAVMRMCCDNLLSNVFAIISSD